MFRIAKQPLMHLTGDGKRVAESGRHIVVLWWRVLRVAYLRFCFSGALIMAAAIAFYSVICFGPLGILFAAALQLLLGPGSESYLKIQQVISDFGADAARQIMPQVDGLLQNPDAHIASLASVVAVIWAGMRLFDVVERSMTAIWPGRILRGLFARQFVAMGAMMVAGLLLASFVLVNAFFAAAEAWLRRLEVDVGVLGQLRPPFMLGYQFMLSLAAFALLYKFMPAQRVATRVALVGAIAAAVLWLGISPAFTYVISRSHQYGSIYGGLAGVVVFSLWAFVGAEVLLIGGHFAVAYEHIILKGQRPEDDDALAQAPKAKEGD